METDMETGDVGEARWVDDGQLEELIAWFESNPNLPEKIGEPPKR